MPEHKPISAAHRLEYSLLSVVMAFFRILPEGLAWRLASLLGLMWYALDRKRRNIAIGNIAGSKAYPWSKRPGIIARANFIHLARNVVEFARLPHLTPAEVGKRVEFEGVENYEKAAAKGRGVLMLTAHIGNWEFVGYGFSACFEPISVVAR